MRVEYREGASAFDLDAFLAIARRVRQDEYDAGWTAAALAKTINIGAWADGRLVGVVRVPSDDYFLQHRYRDHGRPRLPTAGHRPLHPSC